MAGISDIVKNISGGLFQQTSSTAPLTPDDIKQRQQFWRKVFEATKTRQYVNENGNAIDLLVNENSGTAIDPEFTGAQKDLIYKTVCGYLGLGTLYRSDLKSFISKANEKFNNLNGTQIAALKWYIENRGFEKTIEDAKKIKQESRPGGIVLTGDLLRDFKKRVTALREGKYGEVYDFTKAILANPLYQSKDNIYNISATLLLAQNYFYCGYIPEAERLFADGLYRDKDYSSINNNMVNKQYFQNTIKSLAENDLIDIMSFYYSQFMWLHGIMDETGGSRTIDTLSLSLLGKTLGLPASFNGLRMDFGVSQVRFEGGYKDQYFTFEPEGTSLPPYLQALYGERCKLLTVGPTLGIFKFGVNYNLPVSSKVIMSDNWFMKYFLKYIGSTDYSLSWERRMLALIYHDYDVVGTNGIDSYNDVSRKLEPKDRPFNLINDRIDYKFGVNSTNLKTFNKDSLRQIFWLNLLELRYSGSSLVNRSAADIYDATDRKAVEGMTAKRWTMQEGMNAQLNDRDHYDAADLAAHPEHYGDPAYLFSEFRSKYDTFNKERDRLDASIIDKKNKIRNAKNGTLQYHAIDLAYRVVVNNPFDWGGRVKLSPFNMRYVFVDQLTDTENGLWPYIGSNPYFSWRPEISWQAPLPEIKFLGIPEKTLFLEPMLFFTYSPQIKEMSYGGGLGFNINNSVVINVSYSRSKKEALKENEKDYKSQQVSAFVSGRF